MDSLQGEIIRVSHCVNELNLRNRWTDPDDLSIRLSESLVRIHFPKDERRLLEVVEKIKTSFFRRNRISRSQYVSYLSPYLSTLEIEGPRQDVGDKADVDSEETLFELTKTVLYQYKEQVEATHLWQPFWNEDSMTPKKETSLQPTVFHQLRPEFRGIGIEFTKEPDDGAGPLDFRCTATCGSEVYNCCIEFKRAQHGELERKLRRQLPSYMDAAGTKHGVFFVFWFKDGVNCKLPKKKTYSSPTTLRSELLEVTRADTSREIEVIVVDVTRRLSASRQ